MPNTPYLDQLEIDGTTYDLRAANGSPLIEGYGGLDLSEEFENAAALHTAIAAGDFSKIHIGDFFPITLNGTYKDFALYTVPSGTTYYTDAALATEGGTTDAAMTGTYQSATAVKNSVSGSDAYVSIAACTLGVEKTLSNAIMKMEVAAINPYLNHGDTEFSAQHVLLCSRDCLPPALQYRSANSVWYDETQTNPWRGSALWRTLNDPDNGIIKLVEASALGSIIFGGPNSKGMRAMLPTMAAGAGSPSNWAWTDRGKLFLPTEREVYGAAAWGNAGGYDAGNLYNQWPIFAGSSRHIIKGAGNGGGRSAWWLEAATSATHFASVSGNGYASSNTAAYTNIRAPLCFLIT